MVRWLLVLITACSCGLAQQGGTAAVAPRIILNLPHNISPEVVWVRYSLYGPVGSGGTGRHYIAAVFDGAPARYAKVVIYAPQCKFATYDLDLASGLTCQSSSNVSL
jgi:hypothetical protein